MEEIKCEQIGQIAAKGFNEMTGRVYSVNGASPAIRTFCGGNQEVKILDEPLALDEQNGYIRKDGTVGTLTTDGSSPKHNNRIVEPLTTRFSDVASTLRASMHKQGSRNLIENIKNGKGYEGVIEPLVYDGFNQQVRADQTTVGCLTRNVGADLKRNGQGIIEPKVICGIGEKKSNGGTQWYQQDRVYDNELAISVTTSFNPFYKDNDYRVRKLTERECFKLMGVKVEDFSKIRRNQSKSSCYHLAGDSIVSTVLMALFGQMLDIDWQEKVNELVGEIVDV